MARNWARVGIKSEDWESGDRGTGGRAGAQAEEGLPGEPAKSEDPTDQRDEARRTRCGAHGVERNGGEAQEVTRRTKITHDLYDSKMTYGETTHKIEILLRSLSRGTRVGTFGVGIIGCRFVLCSESRRGWISRTKDGMRC